LPFSEGRGPVHISAIAEDGEEAVEVGGPEDGLDGRRELAEPELPAGAVDPPLEQDQLAEERAGDQVDTGEVEDHADRLAVVRQRRAELVGDLANGPVVEQEAIAEGDDLDAFRLGHLDTHSGGHRGLPADARGELIGPSVATGYPSVPRNAISPARN